MIVTTPNVQILSGYTVYYFKAFTTLIVRLSHHATEANYSRRQTFCLHKRKTRNMAGNSTMCDHQRRSETEQLAHERAQSNMDLSQECKGRISNCADKPIQEKMGTYTNSTDPVYQELHFLLTEFLCKIH